MLADAVMRTQKKPDASRYKVGEEDFFSLSLDRSTFHSEKEEEDKRISFLPGEIRCDAPEIRE